MIKCNVCVNNGRCNWHEDGIIIEIPIVPRIGDIIFLHDASERLEKKVIEGRRISQYKDYVFQLEDLDTVPDDDLEDYLQANLDKFSFEEVMYVELVYLLADQDTVLIAMSNEPPSTDGPES